MERTEVVDPRSQHFPVDRRTGVIEQAETASTNDRTRFRPSVATDPTHASAQYLAEYVLALPVGQRAIRNES